MNQENSNRDLSHHILPNSATMVGVCITVLTLVKSFHPNVTSFLIDKALAIDSVIFMLSAVLSFYSIRAGQNSAILERWAEMLFLLGLISMTLITLLFSFVIY